MTIPDPFCGAKCAPLYKMTMNIARFEIIYGVLSAVIDIFFILAVTVIGNEDLERLALQQWQVDEEYEDKIKFIFAFALVFDTVVLVFGIILYLAATKRNKTKCYNWLVGHGFYLVFLIMELGISIWTEVIISVIWSVCIIFFQIYAAWIVLAFTEELITDAPENNQNFQQIPINLNQHPPIQQYQSYPESHAKQNSDSPNTITV